MGKDKHEHFYHTVKSLTEFAFIPAHFLSIVHLHAGAIWLGGAAFAVFFAATIYCCLPVSFAIARNQNQESQKREEE